MADDSGRCSGMVASDMSEEISVFAAARRILPLPFQSVKSSQSVRPDPQLSRLRRPRGALTQVVICARHHHSPVHQSSRAPMLNMALVAEKVSN